VDLSLYMLPAEGAKSLTPGALSGLTAQRPGMLRDVNNCLGKNGKICVSPINRQDSSNLKIHKFISLDKTVLRICIGPPLASFFQRNENAKVPLGFVEFSAIGGSG
jgi:hypothetical protein